MVDTATPIPQVGPAMALRFLDHGGAMGRRIRDHDWGATPLGAIETWPTALRTALGICLASSHPTAIYWGPELRLLYNDAWAPIPGERHPACLGRTAREVWPDLWEVIEPQFAGVLASGDGFAVFDQPLTFQRGDTAVDTWWNYSFSPIRDEAGEVVGIFNEGTETTRFILAERERRSEVERLRELFQQAPAAVALLHGPGFVIEFANDAYAALTGHRALVGRPLAEALPEVVEGGFLTLLEQVRATGEPYRAQAAPVPLFRGDGGPGETRLLDFVYQPIRGADGTVVDVLVQANDVTERARAEMALRESQERLELALGSSLSIGTWDWDVTADRVTADARFAELYGVDPAVAAAGAPITAFFGGIHPDDRPRVEAAVERTLATGAGFAEEYRLVRPSGRHVWVTAQGRATFDAEGRPTRFPGVSFDITQRRNAEEAARIAATDLQLANEAQAFVFRLAERLRMLDDPAEIMRLCAQTLARRLTADRVGFYRLASDEVAQFLECWHSERLPAMTGTMPLGDIGPNTQARYRAGETLVSHDYREDPQLSGSAFRVKAAAGIGVPLRRLGRWTATLYVNAAHPRRWAADEISLVEAVAEVAWDAVERAQATAALRESEGKFRAIANSIDHMVWSTTPEGYHDYFNERWYDFTGVPHGTTDGDGWNGIFHPDDQDRAWSVWRHSLETGEDYRIEYRLRHRSGFYRWVLGRAQAVRDEGGRIVRWFGTCTDIQEIVEAREVLARSRSELEAAIAERTRQLMTAEEQLRQAQKMEALGQLTGGIAHDFNNMLAVVIGALDLLERRVAQGRTDVARYVEAARDGATRAASLTGRLLSFSRQTPLAPAAISLNDLIMGMTELLSRTLGEGIAVETRLAHDLWTARADRSQLENAVINLAVNARDAMPRGGRLSIATENVTLDADEAAALPLPSGEYVRLSVSDTGVGMDADVAAKAFDPFFTTKSVGKGTGLGLSQVFGFVRQSGGHVRIVSAPGEGTSVSILLPCDRAAAPVPVTVAHGTERRGSPREVILVVEDEERVRNFSVEALRELGYTVVHAEGGPQALAMIDGGQRAALLFTDVVMPDMNGRELAEAARARLPDLRVLFTSGYTRDAVERGGQEEGAVLRKPFDVTTLATRVRQALDA